ncbi:hypothetical protein ACWJKU_08620 [Methylocaldum sp. MU1018]
MTEVFKSLEQISTGYSVFEKDQVLTHDQLNSIAGYLGDQGRLTRAKVLGVGVVCGLRITAQSGAVTLTQGLGITTDGDLLRIDADTVYDKYKRYDESMPKYAPFYSGETMIPLYELVAAGVEDNRAASLTQFGTDTGSALADMAAVLYMESYVKDEDLCSGTDCDNLGRHYVDTVKLLLVDKSSLGALKSGIATPDEASRALSPVAVDRALFSAAVATPGQVAQAYRSACNAVHNKLSAELAKLYPHCSAFLGEVFAADPAPAWSTRLDELKTRFGSSHAGIQYYYDFLKDLAETYNDFLDRLFGDTACCNPDIDSFPKHLLLGNLIPGTNPDENRTGFYPSPLTSRTSDRLSHAKFLARKLNTLIRTFQLPTGSAAIRITPSRFEDRPLEERAIPYYYRIDAANPVHKVWNYRLNRRGLDAHNYSYNAGAYGAQGAAASPLTAQIGGFSFFRIEGHLGQNVSSAIATIESEIASRNLPFTVASVMLDTDKTKVVKKPGIRYTDLHRFHYVLRQEIFHQLDEVSRFSGVFKQQVDDAVAAKYIEDSDGPAAKDVAAQKHATVSGKSAAVRTKLGGSYSQYKSDVSWKNDFNDTVRAAGEFKYNLGKAVRTEFSTPFDSLIANTHVQWLDWLDEVIKNKEDKEDERLLFGKFITRHPGLEHYAGVVRGGTFVLVYDGNKTVVGDFMLPYYCCDTAEEETDEPVLSKPGLRPDWILDHGIQMQPSREKFLKDRLDVFEKVKLADFKGEIVQQLGFQKEYLNVFKDSVTMVSDVYRNLGVDKAGMSIGKLQDEYLDLQIKEAEYNRQKADYLRRQASRPDLTSDAKAKIETQLREAESELAKSIERTAGYVASSGMDVSSGSDGYKAMQVVADSMASVTDAQALGSVKTRLEGISAATGNANLKRVIGTMLKR